ncbi:major facilitator superfamily domain-containing protein, partial [Hygrophoropsis aurantiaca]
MYGVVSLSYLSLTFLYTRDIQLRYFCSPSDEVGTGYLILITLHDMVECSTGDVTELQNIDPRRTSQTSVLNSPMSKGSVLAFIQPSVDIIQEDHDVSFEKLKSQDGIEHTVVQYTLYKRRYSGLIGFIILGLVTGMPWSWFGPISDNVASDFDISLNQVNWLGNIISCLYLPVSLSVPLFCSRYGIRRCSEIGTAMLLISGWVRYAGTITSLSPNSSYALLLLGQMFSAVAQPIFQVLGPMYSEKWFDLRGRTTATMIIAVANPVGGALGQLLSPVVGTSRQSVMILAIISTAASPALFLIDSKPPTPPTYAGSKKAQSLFSFGRAMLGMQCPQDAYMSPRERLDFTIVVVLFGVLVGAVNAMSILSAQYLEPAGYSDDISGLMGATLLLSGIVASIITAPLFDRILTHHLGFTLKLLVPIV